MQLKRFFKRNTHNLLFKALAGFGKSMYRFYENRNHDALSNGEFIVLKKLAKIKPGTIFDVGANVGHYAELVIRTNPDATLYCFEPVQNTFMALEKNLGQFSKSNLQLVKQGLFKEDTSREINIYRTNELASLFDIKGIDYGVIKKEKIDLVSCESFMTREQIHTIDFIKLDLEGAEMDALLGMQNALANRKIRAIQFEYGYINITTKNLLGDYYAFFENCGYILGKVYPKSVEFRAYKHIHEDFIGPNFIAVHKSDSELINLLQS